MELFLFITGLALVSAGASFEPIFGDYHEDIGIPEATRINKAEAARDFDGNRIAGGTNVKLGEHAFMGGLVISLKNGKQSMCGSSLVSNTRLVTAAHCWRSTQHQGKEITVVLGSIYLFSGGVRIKTADVQIHENYNKTTLNDAIAIISIPHVAYSAYIQKIALYMYSLPRELITMGFGKTFNDGTISSNPRLRQVKVPISYSNECSAIYGQNYPTSPMICTSGWLRTNSPPVHQISIGPCQGDIGGPAFLTWSGYKFLAGVVSVVSQKGCHAHQPAGHIRIDSYVDWIRERL